MDFLDDISEPDDDQPFNEEDERARHRTIDQVHDELRSCLPPDDAVIVFQNDDEDMESYLFDY